MTMRNPSLFTDEELETLDKAGRILASAKLAILKDWSSYRPSTFRAVDKALKHYSDWRYIDSQEAL